VLELRGKMVMSEARAAVIRRRQGGRAMIHPLEEDSRAPVRAEERRNLMDRLQAKRAISVQEATVLFTAEAEAAATSEALEGCIGAAEAAGAVTLLRVT
jgi:hypothetical protein